MTSTPNGIANVDALVGNGKMFAVGDNRILIAQRNGHGRIRGYAGLRLAEDAAREWTKASPDRVRANLLHDFAGWAPALTYLIESGDFVAVRPLYALPIGHGWKSQSGITLLGDAAHLMSPFSGEGVNLALADAADLADAPYLRRKLAGRRCLRDRDHGACQAGRRRCGRGIEQFDLVRRRCPRSRALSAARRNLTGDYHTTGFDAPATR